MAKSQKNQTSVLPWVLGIIGLAFVALLAIQMTTEKTTNIEGLPAGTPAPGFTLQSTQGDISIADYKGKKVILYFYEGNS